MGEDSRVCAVGRDVIRFGKAEVCHVEGRVLTVPFSDTVSDEDEDEDD